jgi:hypothetical protein
MNFTPIRGRRPHYDYDPRVFFTACVTIRRSSLRLGAGVESTIEVAGIP